MPPKEKKAKKKVHPRYLVDVIHGVSVRGGTHLQEWWSTWVQKGSPEKKKAKAEMEALAAKEAVQNRVELLRAK
jgi:hypothetical protein